MSWGNEEKKEVKKTLDTNKGRGFVTLIYGDTGTGKTMLSQMFPEPIYIVDTENRAINTRLALFPNKEIHIEEPLELKKEITKTMDDIFDEVASIDNLSRFLSGYVSDVKSGKIKGGTLVIDSVSDVWEWCSSWGYDKLQYMTTSKGEQMSNPDLMKIQDQRMWKVATNKHKSIILVLRSLVNMGIYIVFTAKEKSVPEYATNKPQGKEKIRSQKDVPFATDVIINLKRESGKHVAYIEKLGVQKPPSTPLYEITFEKIIELKPLGD